MRRETKIDKSISQTEGFSDPKFVVKDFIRDLCGF